MGLTMSSASLIGSRRQIKQFYYITHIDNLTSILESGILSHRRIEQENVPFTRIYDAEIVATRRQRQAPDGQDLWSFANLYFQPRNAMLYRVLLGLSEDEVVVLGVVSDVLAHPGSFISLGNAASLSSDIVPAASAKEALPEIRKWIDNVWWTEEVGLKRRMMAEVLVPEQVSPDYIRAIYVGSHAAAERAQLAVSALKGSGPGREVIVEPFMFFQPVRTSLLTPRLSIAEGDMFFSKMQTLTISVNTVGVMGKGLASRAKYQFPDVYVRYQDVCRAKRLIMGRPYLYKRETSLDHQLAADPASLPNGNGETWFLLFPTKRHWREQSDIAGIEEGLIWLAENYRKEGITSLAMPALGCGLGRLEWRDVGPLMVRYLSKIDIRSVIYLPAERRVQDEYLTAEFLLPAA